VSRLAVALLAVVVASTASANVWQHAIERNEPDLGQHAYEASMHAGDEAIEQATSNGVTREILDREVRSALDAYRAAANARPEAAEPWFRIADVLFSFYVHDSVPPSPIPFGPTRSPIALPRFDRVHAHQLVDAWDEAEKRAPLDPRFSVMGEGDSEGILMERAILQTRLIESATPSDATRLLHGAASDYEKILARADSTFIGTEMYEQTVGNLAETYMMLDDLDRAIEMYRTAVRISTSDSTVYGLAVALDRDDQPEEAIDLIVAAKEKGARAFIESVNSHRTFFVPEGEVHYYIALINEALGHDADAIESWREFIQSGAHPEFQPRAKQHLDALVAHRGFIRRAPPPFDEPTDP
jgi:tetratricopeptide (TPR) repeat protein